MESYNSKKSMALYESFFILLNFSHDDIELRKIVEILRLKYNEEQKKRAITEGWSCVNQL